MSYRYPSASALVLGLLAAACCLSLPALAQDAGLPDLVFAQSQAYRAAAYPDWQDDALQTPGYSEHRRTEGGVTAAVAIQASRDVWVSVLYYAQTGRGYRMLDALPLPARQHVRLTYPLPPGDAGLSRLLVWSGQPSADLLAALTTTPLDNTRRVRGLLDERWFPRSATLAPPSAPDARMRFQPGPGGFLLSRWPFAYASLDPDGTVQARNSSLAFRGLTRTDMDNWGAFGQWQLGQAAPLTLSVDIPLRRSYSRATLLLRGTLAGVHPQPVTLRLEANGWQRGETVTQQPAGTLELVSFDVSHDLQAGLNTLSVRGDGFGSDWLLRSIELWLE